MLALEHRHGELAQHLRRRGDGALGRGFQGEHRVPKLVCESGHGTEQRKLLLQINADATEENFVYAYVRLIGQRRRVERKQNYVVALRDQLRRESVVAQTTAAVHACGSRGDGEDLQYTPSTT